MEIIIKFLIVPSNLIILLFITGVLLFFIKSLNKPARYLLTGAAVIYLIFATGPVSFWLLGKLEYQYPYLKDASKIKGAEYIVVLSAYADDDTALPLSSRVNSSGAFRLMEALRIHRALPETKIIITGTGGVPNVMKEVLTSMGTNENRLIVENNSVNTYDNLKNIYSFVGNRQFILVTSAGHMPRSLGISRKLGLNPVPAPTDYLTFKNYMAISYLPSPLHLNNSDLAIHEYIGILWYRLTNRI